MTPQRQPIDHHDACIFLVDDEPANLKLLEKILRPQGYVRLVKLQDPREVLPAYRRLRPDLILLDLYMPNLNGFDVMARIAELADQLEPPILVLTAQNHHDILLRALTQGNVISSQNLSTGLNCRRGYATCSTPTSPIASSMTRTPCSMNSSGNAPNRWRIHAWKSSSASAARRNIATT